MLGKSKVIIRRIAAPVYYRLPQSLQKPVRKIYRSFRPGLPKTAPSVSASTNLTEPAISLLAQLLPQDYANAAEELGLKPVDTVKGEWRILSNAAKLTIKSFSSPTPNHDAALASITFYDANDQLLPPSSELPIHANLGNWSYLTPGTLESVAETSLPFDVPQGASRVCVELRTWNRNFKTWASIIELTFSQSDPQLSVENRMEAFKAEIGEMPLIVLYTTAPGLGHTSLELRPNRLTREYLESGYAVIFFPFGLVNQEDESPYPHCRQFSRDDFSTFLNVFSDRPSRNTFICSSFADMNAIAAVDFLKMHGWRTIYEIRDDMEEFNRVGYSTWYHPKLEARMCREAHRIVTVSPRLAEKARVMIGDNFQASKVRVIPNGVERGLLNKAAHLRIKSAWTKRREAVPTVGYIGHLTPAWFDWPLISWAASQLPEINFEIIGHGVPSNLSLPDNVSVLGPRTHDEFLVLSDRWRIGLIPFRPSPLTFAVDPNKLYEYLACGLRVVSAPMGSVDESPITSVYRDRDEFVHQIAVGVQSEPSEQDLDNVEIYLQTATWDVRARSMVQFMESRL